MLTCKGVDLWLSSEALLKVKEGITSSLLSSSEDELIRDCWLLSSLLQVPRISISSSLLLISLCNSSADFVESRFLRPFLLPFLWFSFSSLILRS